MLTGAACDGDGEPAAGETPDGDAASRSSTATAPPEGPDMEELASRYASGADGKIAYEVTSENWGIHPQGTWRTYRLGADVREDWTSMPFGYEETSVAIASDGGLFFCSKTPSSEYCQEVNSEEELEIVLVLFGSVKEVPVALLSGEVDFESTALPDETIAGEAAKCYEVEVNGRLEAGLPGTEQIKLCFTEEGGLLHMDRVVTFEDTSLPAARLTAVAREASQADTDDFQPPVTPRPGG